MHHLITRCPCGNEITQPTTGRPRLYCSEACRQRAKRLRGRARQSPDAVNAESPPDAEHVEAFLVGESAPVDDQVVCAVHEALLLTVTFRRLGTESRRAFAWRCAAMADALETSIHEYFGVGT